MKNFFKQSGFGIIESTIAIYIVVMGLFGLMSLVTQGLQAQYVNQNTLMASELAQEGIELVRNIRDNNWRLHPSSEWKTDIATAGGAGGDVSQKFAIDYRAISDRTKIVKVDSIDDVLAQLYVYTSGSNNGFYSHDSSNSVKALFNRVIEKKEVDGGLEITCRVKWSERGNSREYIVSTMLYNWKFPG